MCVGGIESLASILGVNKRFIIVFRDKCFFLSVFDEVNGSIIPVRCTYTKNITSRLAVFNYSVLFCISQCHTITIGKWCGHHIVKNKKTDSFIGAVTKICAFYMPSHDEFKGCLAFFDPHHLFTWPFLTFQNICSFQFPYRRESENSLSGCLFRFILANLGHFKVNFTCITCGTNDEENSNIVICSRTKKNYIKMRH